MTETVRIYINTSRLDVPSAATALEAVQAWNPAEAEAVRSGERMLTDSRGLPADPAAAVHNGAILRVIRARPSTGDEPDIS